MQEELSLREQKRIETRQRIEDSATKLVDERGFSDVTVEEICKNAGISRRTFFNYFDSKDSAVLGASSTLVDSDRRDYFLNTPTESVLKLTLDLLKTHLQGHYSSDVIAERRQRIASDPAAALSAMGRHRAKAVEISRLIRQRLEAEPELRRLSECSAETEALIIGGIAREVLWLAMASPDFDSAMSIEERFDKAIELMNTFRKGS
ncbi:TetR family transcriptional regulator [Corynebacterium flavescens]|uniref:TetR family transcriptional regulator n=1 Tax=Corynebacterium flavescens TaxID=28028 RepID=UPI003FD5D63F